MYTTTYEDVALQDLLGRVQTLKHDGIRFVQMCAETTEAGIDLLYTFYDEVRDHALNLCVYGITKDSQVPSIQDLYFAAFSYENETHDLYGVNFANMRLDFGGHFFNLACSEPMTIITPEIKREREKLAKVKAAQAAKAAAAAKKAREEAEEASAQDALNTSAKDADAAAAAKVAAVGSARKMTEEERSAKMEAKLAAMDPEKAAKVRAALAARAAKQGSVEKDGE